MHTITALETKPMIHQQGGATMSSREIAELTGKQHQHVKRDIANMLAELDKDVSNFGRIYLDGSNRKQTEYHLDREHTDCLLTGYSAKARMKVIKRWHDLEQATQPQVPTNFAEALQLAADQAKQLELAAPKVAFVDNYVETSGSKAIRAAAKLLGFKEKAFIQCLERDKFLYRLSGQLTPYASPKCEGLFTVKTGDSHGHAFTQTRITPKGLQYFAERYASELRTH
ncbi:putative DNA-binding protein Roi of bacteriophage BP-933W [Vibrio maritimus]|uniref:Putative DNA-binding protein Roi of bacteriophage BP-933W n=1 Tax=Vibrio maritimus TaxID=990268 RepID=A0A090RWE1_9VIBR|nr:putative DNA-binding protein Roi of bacteriophage BP-933W [Vibrio maritimus]